ncbi:hypothetical protein NP493_2708g00014 [Ridgeia piscesae]|uniref:Uncharacterized protein n=1 Tax=Ridgeia piscesae TaxID=27915 RepID=A0AAD9JE08_RIDPI|nr:hypothetical protein NP493_2708g00014 [Ridgeia piscesae]
MIGGCGLTPESLTALMAGVTGGCPQLEKFSLDCAHVTDIDVVSNPGYDNVTNYRSSSAKNKLDDKKTRSLAYCEIVPSYGAKLWPSTPKRED